MTNLKAVELANCRSDVGRYFANVCGHAVGNGRHEVVQLRLRPFHDKLNASIRQVSHESGHVVVLGELADRVPEADALYMAAVKRLTSL